MTRGARLEEPAVCTDAERRTFARLVREGFPAAERLERRVRDARWLAFHYAAGDTLAAVAALKAPDGRRREDVFEQVGASVDPADYALDLGWVYVVPAHRGNRIAQSLCRQLVARVPTTGLFSSTHIDNHAMTEILLALAFARVGKPYFRRGEQLILFVRRP